MEKIHEPVLKKEIVKYLNPEPNKNFIDCTAGGGGHSFLLLKKVKPKGKVLSIEFDPVLAKRLKKIDKKNLIVVNDSYRNLEKIIEEKKFKPVSGVLLDIGMSSWHLKKSKRGFSFQEEEELDMRYNPEKQKRTAKVIVNKYPKEDLIGIIEDYGEEKFAEKISKKIIKERKRKEIKTTTDLIEIIKKAVPSFYLHKRIHFATRTFQALRIEVNNELGNLKKVLPQTIKVTQPGGRIAVISFHSLEDRIVKNFFKNNQKVKVLTKKPITATKKEIKKNHRARSAKLRVIKIK
ncbi:MAG: 16S rRNA (cytosine(1402)-N(4))-methyltransferase RsmH [Minisyncoccales bacterium]